MSAIAMKIEPIAIRTRSSHSDGRSKETANIVGALIGGFATGAAIAVLLWQFV
jgi:hypothetical protein